LVASAFGGLVIGSTVGCSSENKTDSSSASGSALAQSGEKHACRGLNLCKGQGADGKNACAGQGTCANVAHHSCGPHNECRNLGGCGKLAGANECKGQGGCSVPLAHAWETARKHYEARMKAAGKTFGEAPPAPAEKKE
jgi:hypothetical protein